MLVVNFAARSRPDKWMYWRVVATLPMAREAGDGMELPAGSREICQAEMAQRVGAEAWDARAEGERADDLGPRPQRERLGAIPTRLGDKEPPSGGGEFAPPGQVPL